MSKKQNMKSSSIPKRLKKWDSEENMADFVNEPKEMQKYVGNNIMWRRTDGMALAKRMKMEEKASVQKTFASYYSESEDSDDEDSTFDPNFDDIADYSSDDDLIIAKVSKSIAYGLSATDMHKKVVEGSGFSQEQRSAQRVDIRGFAMDLAKTWPEKERKTPTLQVIGEYMVSQLRFSTNKLTQEMKEFKEAIGKESGVAGEELAQKEGNLKPAPSSEEEY